MNLRKVILLILIVLILDQALKFYVKTHLRIGESITFFSWFELLFVENEGMAWGAKLNDFIPSLNDKTAKLILTLFRLIAIVGIAYWLVDSIKKEKPRVLIIAIALIAAGALGNIIDSVFYGLLFSSSYGHIASFLPEETYGTFLHGKVVDMLHFPLWKGYLPQWLPFYGGDYFVFFEPVFNIADTAISTGVGMLLVFNKKMFSNKEELEL